MDEQLDHQPIRKDRMIKWFDYSAYPDSEPLRSVRVQYYNLAKLIRDEVETGAEKTVAYRKLLESLDCITRAIQHPGG